MDGNRRPQMNVSRRGKGTLCPPEAIFSRESRGRGNLSAGRDGGTILTAVFPPRPAVTAASVPPKYRDKPCFFPCVFFTLNRSLYPSTSCTTSVRADSIILLIEEMQVPWSQSYATEILRCHVCNKHCRPWAVGNAMPCHHTGYDRHDTHIL